MRAVLSKTVGGPDSLVVEEVLDPTPKAGEVIIEVKAVGVNFPDTLIIEDKYQFKPQRPFSPGGEVSGVVEAVGEGVKGIFKGDRVIAMPGWGGMVERLAVRAETLISMPDGMSFEEGAALIMTYGTSYYALKDRAQLKAGEALLVLGAAGGVGAAAVELGKAMGAHVIAAASTNDKVQFALELGADNGLIYPSGPMDKAAQKELSGEFKLASGRDGPDVVYDGVGGDYAEPALRSMDWNGRYLVVGFPAGIPSFPLNLTLLKSVSVVGVFWGAAAARDPQGHKANVASLMKLWTEGKIKPRISQTFPLERAHEAIQALSDRTVMGKVVVTVEFVIRLSPDLNLAALAQAFSAGDKRLHIPGVLTPDSAEAIARVLETETRWKTSVAAGGTFLELPLDGRVAQDPTKQAWLDEAAVDGSSPVMQYIFDTRRLLADRELGIAKSLEDGGDAADATLDFLNSEAFVAFARTVTGDDRIDFADAQASRYRPGHVLTSHIDASPGKNRLYAYVLNFSRDWRADWGGALVFHGEDGHIRQGWAPAFNALNLFAVPTVHAVTQVASFAPRDRLSITGWLRSNSPIGPQARGDTRLTPVAES